MQTKQYIQMQRQRVAAWIHKFLFKRRVRTLLYNMRHFSLSKENDVTIYDMLSYFLRHILGGDLAQRSKSLAFSFFMALPPLLIFVFSLIAYFPVDGLQDEFLMQLRGIVPDMVLDPLTDTVNDVMGHKHSSLLSIGFIVSVILSANGLSQMMMSFNNGDPNIERKSVVMRYLVSIMLVFLLYFLIVLVLCLMLGYKFIVGLMINKGWLVISDFTKVCLNIGRWLILALMTLLTICIIYYAIPVKKQRVGFFSWGAILATLLFFGLTWGLQIYFNNFNRYNLLYGSIGTLLVIMLWLMLNCRVLLIGYELNTSIRNGSLSQPHRDILPKIRRVASSREVK